jgi:hypothetical protein
MTKPGKPHELKQFLESAGHDLAREYDRISSRSKEDPGTAGDEVEENWAQILREWLPSYYPVVTKGRILFLDGTASPQVDVIVLHPSYPLILRNKKLYLAGGVVAAFECKLNLRGVDIDKAYKNSLLIRSKLEPRDSTLYDELNLPIIYGILSHSHSISRTKKPSPVDILDLLVKYERKHCPHPAALIDFIVIADTASYIMHKEVAIGPDINPDLKDIFQDTENFEGILCNYTMYYPIDPQSDLPKASILGSFLFELILKMAYDDPSLRDFASFCRSAGAPPGGIGRIDSSWSPLTLTAPVLDRVRKELSDPNYWSRWNKNM